RAFRRSRICPPYGSLSFAAVPFFLEFGALEQIVETADAVPAIAVAFEIDAMFPAVSRGAVIGSQKIDKLLPVTPFESGGECQLARLIGEVVQEQDRIVAPVVAQSKNAVVSDIEN